MEVLRIIFAILCFLCAGFYLWLGVMKCRRYEETARDRKSHLAAGILCFFMVAFLLFLGVATLLVEYVIKPWIR